MKKYIILIVILLFNCLDIFCQEVQEKQSNLIKENIPEIPTEIQKRLSQYLSVREAYLTGWLPNSQGILINTRFGETEQIHLVTKPGGSRKQLTFFEDYVSRAYIRPNYKRNGFLFVKDFQRNEYFQIYFFDISTGAYKLLSDGESINSNPVWAPDGKRLVYLREKSEGTEILLYDMSLGRSTVIGPAEGLWSIGDWIDSSNLLVFSQKAGQPLLLNADDGAKTPVDQKNFGGRPLPSSDGSGFFFSEVAGKDQYRMAFYNVKEKKTIAVSPDISWQIESYARSNDGSYLCYVVNEDGYSTLNILNLLTNETKRIDELSKGVIQNVMFSPDSKKLGLVYTTSTSPPDVYALDLSSADITRWTYSEIGGLQEAQLVNHELIHYPTFDSINGAPRMISALTYIPKGEGPFPVLVSLHGGPADQSRPEFSMSTKIVQFLVNELGIAVIEPNVRGSSGYSFDFQNLDNGILREDAVKDVGALLQWIRKNEKLDHSKVAVEGGSYGGYLMIASLIHYDEQLKAGIDFWGISNFISMADYLIKNRHDGYLRAHRREYGDERDPTLRKVLADISPANHLDKIKKPMLVVHGAHDLRVPISQSEEVVEALRKNGQTVWYLVAKDDGHGFKKKSNQDYAIQVMATFLKTYLLE